MNENTLKTAGILLALTAFVAFALAYTMNGAGFSIIALIFTLCFGFSLLMLIVNYKSKEQKITRERIWIIIVMGLFASIMIINIIQRLIGVDGESPRAGIPYLFVIAASAVLSFIAVKKRKNQQN